jgi:hypothetical protein
MRIKISARGGTTKLNENRQGNTAYMLLRQGRRAPYKNLVKT